MCFKSFGLNKQSRFEKKILEEVDIGDQMPVKQIVKTEKAPKAIGPYNVANIYDDLIFTAGQLGLNPETMELEPGGIEAETRQSLTNIKNVLESAGSSLDLVLKTTVFLRDMADFAKMNAIYAEYFPGDFPARSTVQVAALPKNGAVEIEAIAVRNNR
jgi:2-iminobutanoate/2-iminopropanoate deaminase